MEQQEKTPLSLCLNLFLTFNFLTLLCVIANMTSSGVILGYYFPVCGVDHDGMVNGQLAQTFNNRLQRHLKQGQGNVPPLVPFIPSSVPEPYSVIKMKKVMVTWHKFCVGIKVGMGLTLAASTLLLMAAVLGVMSSIIRQRALMLLYMGLHFLCLVLTMVAVLFFGDKLCSSSPFTQPANIFSAMNMVCNLLALLLGGLIVILLKKNDTENDETTPKMERANSSQNDEQGKFIWDYQ